MHTMPQRTSCATLVWVERSEWVPNAHLADDNCRDKWFCVICQDTIVPGEHVALFSCVHHFHYTCARKWMLACIRDSKDVKCPVCNFVAIRTTLMQPDSSGPRALVSLQGTNVDTTTPAPPPSASQQSPQSPSRTSCTHGVRRVLSSWCAQPVPW